jgi:hypothetical protein
MQAPRFKIPHCQVVCHLSSVGITYAQVRCRLSRRQRRLYDEYMTSGETRSTLAGGNFMGIISCLMQLRKVRALGLGLEGF